MYRLRSIGLLSADRPSTLLFNDRESAVTFTREHPQTAFTLDCYYTEDSGQYGPEDCYYTVEVVADETNRFLGNGSTYSTVNAAVLAAQDLFSRWTLVREWRIVTASTPGYMHDGAVYHSPIAGDAASTAHSSAQSGQVATPAMLALGILGGAFVFSGHLAELCAGVLALTAWLVSLSHGHGAAIASMAAILPFGVPDGAIPRNARGATLVDSDTFAAMVSRVLALVSSATPEQSSAGALWYPLYGAAIAAKGEVHGFTRAQAMGIFAVCSPRRNPQDNYALFAAFVESADGTRLMADQRAKCEAIAASTGDYDAVLAIVSGPKVTAFYRNLMGDATIATIDRHAYAAIVGEVLSGTFTVSPTHNRIASAVYGVAASMLAASVSTVQAIVWLVWRANKGIASTDMDTMIAVRETSPGYGETSPAVIPALDASFPTKRAAMTAIVDNALANGHTLYGWTHDASAGYSATGCMVCGASAYVQESLSHSPSQSGYTYGAAIDTARCVSRIVPSARVCPGCGGCVNPIAASTGELCSGCIEHLSGALDDADADADA